MKNVSLKFWAGAGLIIGLLAFSSIKEGNIQGKVVPAEGVKEVMAFSATDTIVGDLSSGTFVFSKIKKGTYTVWVKANAPYKDASVPNVVVTDSATTDVGVINLQQ